MGKMIARRPILVVEDSDHDYAILEMCLKTAGIHHRLVRCTSGESVERYFCQIESGTTELPVFVFLDLNLPGTDGSTVLRRFKASETLSPIPVAVLTTSSRPKDIEICYKMGASGFLIKPIDLDKFETMVRQVADYWFSAVKLPEGAAS